MKTRPRNRSLPSDKHIKRSFPLGNTSIWTLVPFHKLDKHFIRRMSLKETRIREERKRNEESSGILQQETTAIQVNHAYVDCGKESEKTTTPEEVEMEPNDSGFTYSVLQTDEV